MAGYELKGRSGVYRVFCVANGRHYVGSTKNLLRRYQDHFGALNSGTHRVEDMQVDYDFYSESAFQFSVYEYCSQKYLLSREQYYLDTDFGFYNTYTTAGSPLGHKPSEETLRAIRLGRKKFKKPVVAILPETGEVVGEFDSITSASKSLGVHTGTISRLCRQKSGWAKLYTFRYLSEWNPTEFETFRRITPSESSGRAKAKSVAQFLRLPKGGLMELATYPSIASAEKTTGVHNAHITKVCKGDRKSAGGYVWQFLDTNEENAA